MLLSVDIGNSTIGLGLFLRPLESPRVLIKKIPTYPLLPSDAYKRIFADFIKCHVRPSALSALVVDTIISSVVPSLNSLVMPPFRDIRSRNIILVNYKTAGRLTFEVRRPQEVGADRIANAVAGFHLCRKPVAIADVGTATTITVVGSKMNLLGGTILPGLELMRRALNEKTAQLPSIMIRRPRSVLGKSTVSGITSGIVYGSAGAIDMLIKDIEKELHYRLKLILTGGHAEIVAPFLKRNHVVMPNLTFEGLRWIYLSHTGDIPKDAPRHYKEA
ncbi:MAG: type III pantothenate kinase [Dissulfurispiraceae bacterium]